MRPELELGIVRLYEVFGHYRLKPRLRVCPCCIAEEEEAALHDRPLRELGPAELAPVAAHVPLTSGDTEDFRFFLPRLLELMADEDLTGEFYQFEPAFLLPHLNVAGWLRWPESEVLAVESYLISAWHAAIAGEFRSNNTAGWIEGILLSGMQGDELVEAWLTNPGKDQALALACFAESVARTYKRFGAKGEPGSQWRMEHAASYRLATAWLKSARVRDYLEAAAERHAMEYCVEDWSCFKAALEFVESSGDSSTLNH